MGLCIAFIQVGHDQPGTMPKHDGYRRLGAYPETEPPAAAAAAVFGIFVVPMLYEVFQRLRERFGPGDVPAEVRTVRG